MPLVTGYGKPTVDRNIAQLIKEGRTRAQAVAVALAEARRYYFAKHGRQAFPPWHLRTPEEKARTGYAKNPVPKSSHVKDIEAAKRLYHKFTGHDAEEIGTIDKPPIPGVLVAIGTVDGILYTTVRDGVTEKYVHRFKSSSRPLFAVSPDGKSLFMIGGSYNFTERGIVDED
jgi:hypothetical protein